MEQPGSSSRFIIGKVGGLSKLMKYFVYILQSTSTGKFYIGSTKNLEERILRHNKGYTPSTRFRGPWKIVYEESYPDRSLACKRELQIKKWKSKKAIKELINRGVEQPGSSLGS